MVSVEIEKEDIKRFATKIGTHPAIVAGRLANRGVMKQREGNVYGGYKKFDKSIQELKTIEISKNS
ncbi:MAG: hypothetical protein ACOYOE_09655 [Chlorobium sp.]